MASTYNEITTQRTLKFFNYNVRQLSNENFLKWAIHKCRLEHKIDKIYLIYTQYLRTL